MSLLGSNNNLVEIKSYYKSNKKNGVEFIVVVDEKDIKDILDKPEELKSKGICTLTTKWIANLSWEQQNTISKKCNTSADPVTGMKQFDPLEYRDAMLKHCMKEWDIKEDDGNGNIIDIPVNPVNINKLPSSVAFDLYLKYTDFMSYTDEELKN